MNKVYKLYAAGQSGYKTLLFRSLQHRRNFLQKRREEALKLKQQLSYKGTEYLRIYNNCTLYQEYDIRKKVNAREQAERFFKHA